MAHKTDCLCPACRYRRGEGKGRLPHLSVRLSESVKQTILQAPEGARAYLERLVRDQQTSADRERELCAKIAQLEQRLAAVADQVHQPTDTPDSPISLDQAEEPAQRFLFSVVIKELPVGLITAKGWAKLTRVKATNNAEAVRVAITKLLGKRCQFQLDSTDNYGRQLGVIAPLKGALDGARVSIQCTRER